MNFTEPTSAVRTGFAYLVCLTLLALPRAVFSAELLDARLTDSELAEGWIRLFDGQTLFGWRAGSDANWRVENGNIIVDEGKPGLLHTTTQFSDYVLTLEFRAGKQTNSGIFLHTPPQPTNPTKDCYELNIAAKGVSPFTTGSLVGRKKVDAPTAADQWQRFEITVQGGHIQVSLDGETVMDYTDPHPLKRGYIGLQKNEGKVEFRNIRLRPLGMKPIFNGVDLTGWKEYPDMKSRFSVTDGGELNVKDGRGQLETTASYGDFVLQLECQTHAENLNSGIFFRCIPSDVMMGYESQIHNGFADGDRTQPVDHGTGGIFRRQPARYVVADDKTWFHKTLIADGPHMAAWVNGVQVSDWTDNRDADENPRRGRRLKPGTIMIQGHDPTTDISFRNLKVGEISARQK